MAALKKLWHKILCTLGQHYGHVETDPINVWFQCAHCSYHSKKEPWSR